MNHDKLQNSSPRHYLSEEDEINLLDLLLVLVKHKKMILGSCLVTFVLTLGITLLLPNIYSATTRILPPKKSDSGVYVSMLKGHAVADAIIAAQGWEPEDDIDGVSGATISIDGFELAFTTAIADAIPE